MKNKKFFAFVVIVLATIFISGCADVSHVEKCLVDTPYGFWSGLWHGFSAPFSFFGRLFSDDIAIYAVNNNGRLYDFGFWLGIGGLASSGGSLFTVRKSNSK